MQKNKSILVVEDEKDIREGLTDLLESEGYSVLTAKDGLEALNLLEKVENPALILLDLTMPALNGFEFRERQKRSQRFGNVPVILLSASDRLEQKFEAMQVNGLLKKPIGCDELLLAVQKYCPMAD